MKVKCMSKIVLFSVVVFFIINVGLSAEILRNDQIIISFKDKDRNIAEDILNRFTPIVSELNREVGFYDVPIIQLVLTHSKKEFNEYISLSDIPENSVAMAMLGLSKIVIQNPKILPPHNDFYQILKHEYLHLMLHAISNSQFVPLWFAEGFVQYYAKQWNLQREFTFVSEAIKGNKLNLMSYSYHYPKNDRQVEMFYLQSYYTFKYLLKRFGTTRFYDFIESLHNNKEFFVAFRYSLGIDVQQFLDDAQNSISSHSIMAVLYSGLGLFWMIIPLLLIIAYVRKRRMRRKIEQVWVEEETGYYNGGHT